MGEPERGASDEAPLIREAGAQRARHASRSPEPKL